MVRYVSRWIFFGQAIFPHHSDQVSQRSQVSQIAPEGCSAAAVREFESVTDQPNYWITGGGCQRCYRIKKNDTQQKIKYKIVGEKKVKPFIHDVQSSPTTCSPIVLRIKSRPKSSRVILPLNLKQSNGSYWCARPLKTLSITSNHCQVNSGTKL